MKTFLDHITEGGNTKVGSLVVSPIPVDKKSRGTLAADVREALLQLSRDFESAYERNLFGAANIALYSTKTYSGSSKHLFDVLGIPDSEFVKHKSSLGDIDVKVDKDSFLKLEKFLTVGKTFGKFRVVGVKTTAGEIHAIVHYSATGLNHQIDFESATYHKHEPHSFEQFSHASSWLDITQGFKGAHRNILINAAGLDEYKFSTLKGLGSRSMDGRWETDTKKITQNLFPGSKKNDEALLHSFTGVVQLIKKHKSPGEQKRIVDKFVETVGNIKTMDSTKAVAYIRQELNLPA